MHLKLILCLLFSFSYLFCAQDLSQKTVEELRIAEQQQAAAIFALRDTINIVIPYLLDYTHQQILVDEAEELRQNHLDNMNLVIVFYNQEIIRLLTRLQEIQAELARRG